MTTGVVQFDPKEFQLAYPEFNCVPAQVLTNYFGRATLMLDNSNCSPVRQIEQRQPLLWLLVAHLAKLNSGANGQGPSDLVGRVSSASEGSVSVSTEYGGQSPEAAWYLQTKYGAEYWAATAQFRTMRYQPGFSAPAGAAAPGFPPFFGGGNFPAGFIPPNQQN